MARYHCSQRAGRGLTTMARKESKQRSSTEGVRVSRGKERPAEKQSRSAEARKVRASPSRSVRSKARDMSSELTTVKKILVAAAQLDEERETFTAEDLIVRAWQQFPESFGLNGYRDAHPDSNRVLSKLMGSVGLCSRGWLEQVGVKTYRLTPMGRKIVMSLRGESSGAGESQAGAATSDTKSEEKQPKPKVSKVDKSPSGEKVQTPEKGDKSDKSASKSTTATVHPASGANEAGSSATSAAADTSVAAPTKPQEPPAAGTEVKRVPPELPKFEGIHALARLATSVASQKFSRGGLVTFLDACQFWAITPAIHPAHLEPRLREIEKLLERAEAHIKATGQALRVDDRLELTLTTVVGLQGLHRMLLQRYHRELDAIRARGEE